MMSAFIHPTLTDPARDVEHSNRVLAQIARQRPRHELLDVGNLDGQPTPTDSRSPAR